MDKEDSTSALERSILRATFQDNPHPNARNGVLRDWTSPAHDTRSSVISQSLRLERTQYCPTDVELSQLDEDLQEVVNSVAASLDGLNQPENSEETVLQELERGKEKIQEGLKLTRIIVPNAVQEELLRDMQERYSAILNGMEQAGKTIRARSNTPGSPLLYRNANFLNDQLSDKDPISLFAAFIVIVLNVFGSLVREWASTGLKLQLELLRLTFGRGRETVTHADEDLLSGFPRDIRSARKLFNLEPIVTTYAACPRCSATYRVGDGRQLQITCTWKRYPKSAPCGEQITKLVIKDENGERKNARVPIRPFLVQDFNAFKASLLNRPGMESLLDRGTLFSDMDDLQDLKDGALVKELTTPDGKPFWDGLKRGELRLLWSLSIDWFNPRGNKAAGKVTSTGSIVMACLNLPPHLRYKPENLFLVGVIPGPKEPSVEEVEHFIEPVVDVLNQSWKDGTKFDRTESCECGRTERSMVAVLVSDLVASRKITGVASHSSKDYFCSLCGLCKDDINNLDRTTWPKKDRESQKKAAEDWRDALSRSERDRLFKRNGIRWTPFWKLEYYDPAKMVVTDSMHNLFLGLVQYHVREVMAVEDPQVDQGRPVTEKEMVDARIALDAANIKSLSRKRVPVLVELCKERELGIGAGKRPRKKDLLHLLIAGSHLEGRPRPPSDRPTQQTIPMNSVFPFAGESDIASEGFPNDVHETTFVGKVTKDELEKLQKCISDTIRPQYRRGPPSNLGEPGHGKLKADQWKTAIEFDIPVFVAQFWSRETSTQQDPEVTAHRDKVFENIMKLAVAVRWGTSYRTSERHAQKFEENMISYLQGLLDLYPGIVLRPNHHVSLHIGPLLMQFGPVHRWWMFPFERIVGLLQKVNTNNKIGELETTMMRTFCAASNLKALLLGKTCPEVLKRAVPLLKKKWDQDMRAGTIGEVNGLGDSKTCGLGDKKVIFLQADRYGEAFEVGYRRLSLPFQISPQMKTLKAATHRRVTIRGRVFATRNQSYRDAEIFFRPLDGDHLVPGLITHIFSIQHSEEEMFILSIAPRKPVPQGTANPFARYPDFGAELWSTKFESLVCIPTTEPIYHSTSRPWADGIQVLKPIIPEF